MSALSLDQYNLIKSFLIPCSKNFGMHKINPAKFSNVPGFSFSSQEKVKEAVEKVEDFMALYDVVSKHHSAFIAKDGLYLVNCPAACNIAAINIQSDKKPIKTAQKAVHRYIGKSPATLTISSTGEFVKASTVPFVYKKGTSQVIVASITDGDKRTTIHRHIIKNKSVLVAPKTRFVFDIKIADSVTPEDVKQYVQTCKVDDAKLPYIQLLLRKMPLKEYTTDTVDPYLKRWNVSVMGTHKMTMFLYLFSFNLYSKDDQREFLIQSAYSGETAINRFCQFLRNAYPEFVQDKLAEDGE